MLENLLGDDFLSGNNDDDGENEEGSGGMADFDMGMDPTGAPTILDAYLYVVADNLGLEIHGLENIEDHIGTIENVMQEDLIDLEYGSDFYEKFVDMYSKADLGRMEEVISQADMDDYDMLARNETQLKSFLKLAKKEATFAAVGAAHLIGEKNILTELESMGYSVKQIARGKPSAEWSKAYYKSEDKKWHTLISKIHPYSIESATQNKIIREQGGLTEFHVSMEFERGLFYFSLAGPASNVPMGDIDTASKMMLFGDDDGATTSKEKDKYGNEVSLIRSAREDKNIIAKSRMNQDLFVMQIVIGISKSALEHPNVNKFFEGLSYSEEGMVSIKDVFKGDADKSEWKISKNEDVHYQYYMPESGEYLKQSILHPEFPERGKIDVFIMGHQETKDDVYLIKHNGLPPGITFLEPYVGMEASLSQLQDGYKAEIIKSEYTVKVGSLINEAELKSSSGQIYFTKIIIRGPQVYMAIQSTKTQKRNDKFFDEFKLTDIPFQLKGNFEYSPSKFSIAAPNNYFKSHTETVDGQQTSFSINDNFNSDVFELVFTKINKYDEYVLSDTTFSYNNIVDETLVDEVLHYEYFKHKDVCPGYIFQHKTDSMFSIISEVYLYCNEHIHEVTVMSPEVENHEAHAKDILESIDLMVDENSMNAFEGRKFLNLIKDLESNDSLIFNEAFDSFYEFGSYTEEETEQLLLLLKKDLLDDEKKYGTKYQVISSLHEYDNQKIEDGLSNFYHKSNNEILRSRILESFAYRSSSNATDKYVNMLHSANAKATIPDDAYTNFNDSLELFIQYYPRLKILAEQNIAQKDFYSCVVKHLDNENVSSVLQNDKAWFREKMEIELEYMHSEVVSNPGYSVEEFMMDYLHMEDLGEKEDKFYDSVILSDDIYGKYRTITNKIRAKEEYDKINLEEVLENHYYRSWIIDLFHEQDIPFEGKYAHKDSIASALITQYVYDNLGYSSKGIEILEHVSGSETGIGEMTLIKTNSDEEDGFFIGLVGPFIDGKFDSDNNESLYYNYMLTDEDPAELKKELLNYLKE